MLNKKGFTMIELLATVAILGVILIIAVPIGTSVYENARIKSEESFIMRLNDAIEEYITLYQDEFTYTDAPQINKCTKNNTECKSYDNYKTTIKFENLINKNIISKADFISPYTRNECNINEEINIYRDEDYVNYYSYDLECISNNNKQSDTIVYSNLPS